MPPQPRVLLDGSAAGSSATGLTIKGNNSRVVGFYIVNFSTFGVLSEADNVAIACNVVGLNEQGAKAGNKFVGVLVSGANNVVGHIDGLAGNVLSGNQGYGVEVGSGNGAVIRGNFIGTSLNGQQARGNEQNGLEISGGSNAIIGGPNPRDRNVIAGNAAIGVNILGNDGGNRVIGNLIGLAADGVTALGNGNVGVSASFDDSSNIIGGTGAGEGNQIAFNATGGVDRLLAPQIRILGNQIFSNGGAALDTEEDLAKPTITKAQLNERKQLEIATTLTSTPNANFHIEFFASKTCGADGTGEGELFLGRGRLRTNGSGAGQLAMTFTQVVPEGRQITATATGNDGNDPASTSKFSACVTVTALAPPSAPQLTPDEATTDEDTPVTIDVLGNDLRGSGSDLVLVAVGEPQSGAAATVTNKVRYTPHPNFNG
ncbi:MAG: hypothetical protein KDE31_29485, partial [Caldilineaceae bacterium]|nr:hypothetical protein [Caldilineaceae bacterium]